MESVKDKILKFVDVGNGNGIGYGYGNGIGFGRGNGIGNGRGNGFGNGNGRGNGNGNGNGYGEGNGYGYGRGNGNGNGNGYGEGNGYGIGYGNGIKNYNGHDVYLIDDVPTIITYLHGNIAKGFVAKNNLFNVPCYVARVGNYFAHGDTAKGALADARTKFEQNRPLKERIADFKAQYSKLTDIVPNTELYRWHNILTGSCAFGRKHFAEQHKIDINNGSMSVLDFIELTINQYGANAIEQLKENYKG